MRAHFGSNEDTVCGKYAINLIPVIMISWDTEWLDIDINWIYWGVEFSFDIRKKWQTLIN